MFRWERREREREREQKQKTEYGTKVLLTNRHTKVCTWPDTELCVKRVKPNFLSEVVNGEKVKKVTKMSSEKLHYSFFGDSWC